MRKRNFVLPVTKDNAKTVEKMLFYIADNLKKCDEEHIRMMLQNFSTK